MRLTSLLLSLLVLASSSFPIKPHALVESAPRTREQEPKLTEKALLDAVWNGQTDVVKSLLAAGADPNTHNFEGTTVLMFAARDGHVEILQTLLAAGANPKLSNKDGMDALMAATSRSHGAIATILKKAGADPASEQFILDMQATARRFAQRLQQTRDFAPLINEFFIKRFLDCHVDTMLVKGENGIFSQIGGSSLPTEVTKHASRDELRRYLIVGLNFFHLKTLYRMSKYKWGSRDTQSFESEERDYPSGVADLLERNPTALKTSKSVEEMRARVLTLEQAIAAMRDHLLTHLPETNEAFQSNVQRVGNVPHNSKFWEVDLYKLPDVEAKGMSKCFGTSVRRLSVVKVPPFYRLFFVEVEKDPRIAAMLCSEPPCAD